MLDNNKKMIYKLIINKQILEILNLEIDQDMKYIIYKKNQDKQCIIRFPLMVRINRYINNQIKSYQIKEF